MANDIGKTHWILDTEGEVTTAPVYITSIEWVGYGSSEIGDDDICQILDKDGGTEIFYRKATGITEGFKQNYPGGLRVEGIYLNDLDSGRVLIAIR